MSPKRFFRSRDLRLVSGVAGGIANYFAIDPIFVRIGFLLLTLLNGIGAIIYLVLWLIMPNEGSVNLDTRAQVRENVDDIRSVAEKLVDRVRNTFNA